MGDWENGWSAADTADVLSTQSTSAPDVVNGISESMEGRCCH